MKAFRELSLGSSPFLAGYISFLETDNLILCPIRHFHEGPLDYAKNTEPHERGCLTGSCLQDCLSLAQKTDSPTRKQ